jgi:hypothetical protein
MVGCGSRGGGKGAGSCGGSKLMCSKAMVEGGTRGWSKGLDGIRGEGDSREQGLGAKDRRGSKGLGQAQWSRAGSRNWGVSKRCRQDPGDGQGVNVTGGNKVAGRSKELGQKQRPGAGAQELGGGKGRGWEQGAGVAAEVAGGSKELG